MKKNKYLLNVLKQWTCKRPFYATIVSLVLVAVISCSEDEPGQVPLDIGSLSVSNAEVVVDYDKPTGEAIVFSWHAEKTPMIHYELVFTAGTKSHTVEVLSEVKKRFIHAQLNRLLVDKLQLEIGKTSNVEVVLHAKVTESDKTAASNMVSIAVTPSPLVPEPPLETVTLSSLRTEAIINIQAPSSETATFSWGTETNVFIEHKLVLTSNGKSATVDVLSNVSKEFTNTELNDILIDKLQLETGKTASVDAVVHSNVTISDKATTSNKVTISVTPAVKTVAVPAYTKMWIVGAATPKDWDINSPSEMVNDLSNKYQFKFNEVLKLGEFKIPAETGDWNGDFYMPPVNHQDLSSTNVAFIPGGSPDNKWEITNAGAYKILLNISTTPSIRITPFLPYGQIYIIGDATTAGWDANNAIAMTVAPGDANIFTWTGELKSTARAQFRFLAAPGDLNADSFVAPSSNAAITATQLAFAPHAIPANNFRVKPGEDGIYKITINQLKETISIVKQ